MAPPFWKEPSLCDSRPNDSLVQWIAYRKFFHTFFRPESCPHATGGIPSSSGVANAINFRIGRDIADLGG